MYRPCRKVIAISGGWCNEKSDLFSLVVDVAKSSCSSGKRKNGRISRLCQRKWHLYGSDLLLTFRWRLPQFRIPLEQFLTASFVANSVSTLNNPSH